MAGVDDEDDGGRDGPRGHSRARRQALQARGLARALPLRLHQAELSHHFALAARRSRERRGVGRTHAKESEFLHAPVHRRTGAVELRADQSRGVSRDDRLGRPESGERPAQPAGRHRARQRQAQDLDDRLQGVRTGRQYRHHARQGRFPERSDAADPVRTRVQETMEAPAADRAAVDQQILHPGSSREKFLPALGGERRSHRIHHLLGEPGRKTCAQELRGLCDRRPACGARRDRKGHRRKGRQRDRLLPWRHVACGHAGYGWPQRNKNGSRRPRS